MLFQLSQPGQIRGDQLVDEIRQALGIDVGERLAFIPPQAVRITGADQYADQLRALVAAHVPDPAYFQADRDASALKSRVVTLAQSAVGVRVDELAAGQVRALLVILLWQASALNRDGVVRPLEEWARQ